MKIDCTSNSGKPCLNCEAYMAGFRAGVDSLSDKVTLEFAHPLARMHRRAQTAESAIRAVERRAEGMCRDAGRRVTEEARVRGLYRKEMRAAADLIRASGLVQCETPKRDGWPRVAEGRLEVLVPRLISECERLRAEAERLRAVCNSAARAMEDSRAKRGVWAPSPVELTLRDAGNP